MEVDIDTERVADECLPMSGPSIQKVMAFSVYACCLICLILCYFALAGCFSQENEECWPRGIALWVLTKDLIQIKLRLEARGLFPCSHQLCSKVFTSRGKLYAHNSKGEHTASTSLVISNASRVMIEEGSFNGRETLSDIIIHTCDTTCRGYVREVGHGVVSAAWPSIQKKVEFPILEDHFKPIHLVNIQDREAGYAQKHSSKRFGFSAKMLRFVVFCFEQGIHESGNAFFFFFFQIWRLPKTIHCVIPQALLESDTNKFPTKLSESRKSLCTSSSPWHWRRVKKIS